MYIVHVFVLVWFVATVNVKEVNVVLVVVVLLVVVGFEFVAGAAVNDFGWCVRFTM